MSSPVLGVLTGDIVGSRKIKPEHYDIMLASLNAVLRELTKEGEASFDIFRGDAYQAVFPEPADAVRAAVVIRLALKAGTPSFAVRQSIGIGEATTLRATVKRSTGEAFVLSGEGLENMKNKHMIIHSNNPGFQSRVELLTKYFDLHLQGLTTIQSQVLHCYLTAADQSHEALAATLDKKRSNVTRLLNASGYQLVTEYLQYIAHYIKEDFQ